MENESIIKYNGYAIGAQVWVANLSNNNVVHGKVVGVKLKNCGYRNAEGDYTSTKPNTMMCPQTVRKPGLCTRSIRRKSGI